MDIPSSVEVTRKRVVGTSSRFSHLDPNCQLLSTYPDVLTSGPLPSGITYIWATLFIGPVKWVAPMTTNWLQIFGSFRPRGPSLITNLSPNDSLLFTHFVSLHVEQAQRGQSKKPISKILGEKPHGAPIDRKGNVGSAKTSPTQIHVSEEERSSSITSNICKLIEGKIDTYARVKAISSPENHRR